MQWIEEADGVFRGGGMKGIALAGALCGFAEHPTKPITTWRNVAGASAGAIIASYLALGHSASEMAALLQRMPFEQFEDFPHGSRTLGVLQLGHRHGMARGDAFREWFDDVLGHATFADVRTPTEGPWQYPWRLRLIAVDVTNSQLLVLPGDLRRYKMPGASSFINPDDVEISLGARMSMSIPYFFEPVELDDADGKRVMIIDGGTLSNFPVWLFDVDPQTARRKPRRATFGFTLTGGRSFGDGLKTLKRLTPWEVRFGADIFHTAQSAWDQRFVTTSTRVRTVTVDADHVGTTDFELDDEHKQLLMRNGRAAARTFLDGFELEQYINSYHEHIDAKAAVPH